MRQPVDSGSFRRLHERGCFVLPNPWDRGSARFLASLGFPALATSSAGFAFGQGLPDDPMALSRAQLLAHISEIVGATALPVSADFQAGFGASSAEVAESVRMCVDVGVAGLSIEDATGDDERPLFPLAEAVERVQAARQAIDASGRDVVLTARAECFLVGHEDPLSASIERLVAYAEVGADCLYAPGLRASEDIAEVIAAVAPRPVNVLAVDPSMTVAGLEELGVRRVSVGSAFARVAWQAFMTAATDVAREGRFTTLSSAARFDTLNDLFNGARA